jgi:site-specific DNA-methyltransferase (adenine-specific)
MDLVYPTNVIHMATECSNRNHSAAFPIELPKWFIKLFTQPDDLVLDPFVGSGTTAIAAIQLGRRYSGIDLSSEYVEMSRNRLADAQLRLPTIGEKRESYQASDGIDPQQQVTQ